MNFRPQRMNDSISFPKFVVLPKACRRTLPRGTADFTTGTMSVFVTTRAVPWMRLSITCEQRSILSIVQSLFTKTCALRQMRYDVC